jgi:hypothetical protein
MSGLMVTLSPPFASLVCHNNHSLVPTALMESGQDVPQLTHVTFPNSLMTINNYKALPSSVKHVVAVMHARLHYAVMDITIDTQIIKIFDGLYQPLLDWKDHGIRAMRKCMLVIPLLFPPLPNLMQMLLFMRLWVEVGSPKNL